MKRKIRLILTGGGIKGSFQAGFIHNLLLSNAFEIDMIYATSVGALMSPLVACNKPSLIERCINSLKNIYDVVDDWPWYYFPRILGKLLIMFKMGRYRNVKMVDIIWNSLTKEEKDIATSKCRIVAWDVQNRKPEIFGEEGKDELYHGIKASCALWLLVPPYKYKDKLYCDGGAGEIFPLEYIIDNDKDYEGDYILIDCSPRYITPLSSTPSNAIELMYELQWVSTEILALKNILELNIICPYETVFYNCLDIDDKKIKYAFLLGKEKFCDYMTYSRKIEKVMKLDNNSIV
jgi:predicted acylesterase/phospholipase RssA